MNSTHVFWNNFSSGAIGRANLDGTGIDQSFITGGVNPQHPSVDGEHIYWSNKGYDCDSGPIGGCTIGRANLDGTGTNQSFITGTEDPASGTATNGTHVFWGSGFDTIGRANVDGSSQNQGFISQSACAIAVDESYIYWTRYGNSSGGWIGRANLDGSGVNREFIATAGGTCGVAVDGITPPSQPPPPSDPPPPTPTPTPTPEPEPAACTNPMTLLVTCADSTGGPGFCSVAIGVFNACQRPNGPPITCTGLPSICRPAGQVIGACGSFGVALPECNVPTREVPGLCQPQGLGTPSAPVCAYEMAPVTVCPRPSSSVTPACAFALSASGPRLRGARARAVTSAANRRRTATLRVKVACPKVLAKRKRCRGHVVVDGLRAALRKALAAHARVSAGVYRYFVTDGSAFAAPFQKSARKAATQGLGTTKLPKAVDVEAVIAALGRDDPLTRAYADALRRAVDEYRAIAKTAPAGGRTVAVSAAKPTATVKAFKLRSGKRRTLRIKLGAAAVRRLVRDAGSRPRVPIRVVIAYKASPMPVVSLVDFALRLKRKP